MLRRVPQTLTRVLVAALVVLVAVGAAMPTWARLVAGPAEHACNCEVRGGHAHCACPLCFPELNDDEDAHGAPSVTGRCGKDDAGWRTLACAGVPDSPFVVLAPLGVVDPPRTPPLERTQWGPRPEPRPPRTT